MNIVPSVPVVDKIFLVKQFKRINIHEYEGIVVKKQVITF